MPPTCSSTKVVGQTLFLGASIVSLNIRMGWGGQASSCNVELVEDFQPASCYANNLPIDHYTNLTYADDHYYTCSGDDCYVDELGVRYNSNRMSNNQPDPPKEKNIPGKLYYAWTTSGIKSRYWIAEDPGFFGTGTRVKPDGTLDTATNKTHVYNLINVPVFLKFDNISFVGIIRSWETVFRQGKNFYNINIESMSNLLNSSYVILDEYAGSIFSKNPSNTDGYGAPRNFASNGLSSIGTIKQGNVHNVFNVYGFLESLGPYGFGGANVNDNGIKIRNAVDALKILTSSSNITQLNWSKKRMFSPFGRILAKTMEKTASYNTNTDTVNNLTDSTVTINNNFRDYSFGVIPPVVDSTGKYRTTFTLDLSDIKIPPDEIRMRADNEGIMSISSFIDYIVNINGQQDYYIDTRCLVRNSQPYNIIKIVTVDKRSYVSPGIIKNTVNDLRQAGYAVTATNVGQESNPIAKVRTMHIGGKQQRLYQAKNYRLAYNQTNFIWDPYSRQFVNYRRFDASAKDKIKIPLPMSVRHPTISVNINGTLYNAIWNSDEDVRAVVFPGQNFGTTDNNFNDSQIISTAANCNIIYTTLKDIPLDLNKGGSKDDVELRGYSSAPSNQEYDLDLGNYQQTIVLTSTVQNPSRTNKPDTDESESGNVTQSPLPPHVPLNTTACGNTCDDYDSYGNYCGCSTGYICQDKVCVPEPTPAPPDTNSSSTTFTINQNGRYIPIYTDVVCPFFGYKLDQTYEITNDSNIHRYVRPVLLDSWTGQIVVSFDLNELPLISAGYMPSLYNPDVLGNSPVKPPIPGGGGLGSPTGTTSKNKDPIPQPSSTPSPSSIGRRFVRFTNAGFLITESEFRAAMQGTDSYLTYCLAKSIYTKPDLFMMLLLAYAANGINWLKNPATVQINSNTVPADPGLSRPPGTAAPTTGTGGKAKQPSEPQDALRTALSGINFLLYLIPQFYKDFDLITKFVANIGNQFYGKKYMVKLPPILSYQDKQYSGFEIPGFGLGNIFVFSGSGKLFYNYEKCDGAWEEYGNYIDNKIVVGGPFWKALSNEEGLIPALLGYNATDKIDKFRQAWCILTLQQKVETIMRTKQLLIDASTSSNDIRTAISTNLDPSNWTNPRSWNVTIKNPTTGVESTIDILSVTNLSQLAVQYGLTDDQASFLRTYIAQTSASVQLWDGITGTPSVGCKVSSISSIDRTKSGNRYTVTYITDSTFQIPSINISSLPADSYVVVQSERVKDAWGADICAIGKKLYAKVNFEEIAFGNPESLSDPRAIVSMPSAIELTGSSFAYEHDPNLTVAANVAAEDVAFFSHVKNPNNMTEHQKNLFRYLESYHNPIVNNPNATPGGNAPAVIIYPGSRSNSTKYHHAILRPKAAQPFFAAIPLKSNMHCYGPWVNYPNLVRDSVFGHLTNPDSFIENQIGNISVKQDQNLVPWKYGGMSFLDKAVSYMINAEENYQTVLEKGNATIYGPPIFSMGGYFTGNRSNLDPYTLQLTDIPVYDYREINSSSSSNPSITYTSYEFIKTGTQYFFGYPIIDGITMNIGNEGITTNYSFATYSPKNGLYAREYTQRITDLSRQINSLSSKLTKSINQTNNNIDKKIIEIMNSYGTSASREDYPLTKIKNLLFGESPGEALIGSARPFLPYVPESKDIDISNMYKSYRHETWAGIFQGKEVGEQLSREYSQQSAMSMDGLFSPISFYPTPYDGTYALSNLETAKSIISGTGIAGGLGPDSLTNLVCSVCKGTKKISDTFVDYSSSSRAPVQTIYPCPACSRSKYKIEKNDKGRKNDPPDINLYTLNPIIVSKGEFENPNSPRISTTGIYDKHSIRAVARGEFPPAVLLDFDTTKNLNYEDNIVSPDYDAFDSAAQVIEGSANKYLMNQRFFALRGPLMVHGWGYDTEGYPVPNLYDDPVKNWQLPNGITANPDDKGRYLRFILKSDGTNDLTKAGAFLPTDADPNLGDIITQRYEWKTSKWVKKSNSSKYFSSNWGSNPDKWPVGPIDLRWNSSRRVWDASGGCGPELLPPFIVTNSSDVATLNEYLETKTSSKCPYKLVYVTLEQDLVKQDNFDYSYPARAFIDDLEYKSTTLQRGYRRLVYVMDRSGYTAPRGIKLYCKYNSDNGFYEPISKPTVTAMGLITGNQVRLDMHYIQGRRAGVVPTMTVNYDNPMGFTTTSGRVGMFTYINGKWTLTTINS